MKVFNSKLAAIGLAAFVFASCSDSNSDGTTNVPIASMNSKIIGSDLVQNTNAQELASRVLITRAKLQLSQELLTKLTSHISQISSACQRLQLLFLLMPRI